tara:strand:- start:223 stop:810 length:588 start_codon:yes stop_codon:yes gene_type:complete
MFSKNYELGDCFAKLVVYDRNNDNEFLSAMYLRVFFSRFSSLRMLNKRYISSRYRLLKLIDSSTKHNYRYSFSHSYNTTALVASSKSIKVSVDLESKKRKVHSSLENKLRSIFPSIELSVLKIISILECLVKLSVIRSLTDKKKGISNFDNLTIKYYNQDSIIISTLNGKNMYSKFIDFEDLTLCLTTNKMQLLL